MVMVCKFIAYPADRMKIYRVLLIRLKVLSECKNKIINGTCRRVYIIVPDSFQNLFARNGFIFTFDKQLKQHRLFLCKRRHATVCHMQLKRVKMDRLIPYFVGIQLFQIITSQASANKDSYA